jgi:hypothetical protein
MLRVMSALFGTIFLPIGMSFFFVLRHRYWMQGIGAVLASGGFFYVAYRAEDILALDAIPDTREILLPELLPPDSHDPEALPPPDGDPAP